MIALKKILAFVMTFAMVMAFVVAAPAAFADGGVSMAASGEGGTVTLTVSFDAGLENVGGLRFNFTVPDGFVLTSESHYSGLSAMMNTDKGYVYIDSDDSEDPIDIPAGATALTAVFQCNDKLEAREYDFTVTMGEAFDDSDELVDYSVRGASATATYTVVAPAVPTADPDSGEVEKGTEVKFSSETEGAEIYYSTDGGETWTKGDSLTVNEKVTVQVKAVKDGVESKIAEFSYTVKDETPPAEPTPAPTEKPAEPTPAPTEKPAEPTPTPKPVNPNNPTTGDESNLMLYVVIMAATLALGAVTFVVIRKGNKA